MSYDPIPFFGDPMAKIKDEKHDASGARKIDILYGAQNSDGSPKSPENEDGHGHFIAVEIDGLMQGISWRHSKVEGEYDEYLGSKRASKRDEHSTKPLEKEGVDRKDIPLTDLEAAIRQKRKILRDVRQLMSHQRYSIAEADALLSSFAAIYDMNTPIEQELKQKYEQFLRRNRENSHRFQEQDRNAAKKRDLITQTKSIQGSSQWADTSRRMNELMDAWKQIGYAGEGHDRLWEEFQQARQVFFDRRRKHNEESDALRQERKVKKRKIISNARDLTRQVENWKSTHEKLEALLNEWKKVGSAGKDDDDRLWEEFSEVRDDFYARRQKAREDQEHEFELRRKAKWALISEAEEYARVCDYSKTTAEHMRGLNDKWKQIGFCGKDHDDQLWNRFQQAQNLYWAAKKAAGAKKHQEWRAKTQDAINRRRDQIGKIQKNINNLYDRLTTTQNSAKLEEIQGWIDEDQEKIRRLEEEIYRMEQELGRG